MFSLQSDAIDIAAARDALRTPASGGYCSFEGWVRNHHEGRPVDRLVYEAYPTLAVQEGKQVIAEAVQRFDINAAACIHRTGTLAISELAVWVGVSAAHRADAFEACRYIIDQVKARVPIWKKEFYKDGSSVWVNCAGCAPDERHSTQGYVENSG